MKKDHAGFTLVEIMIVVGIIGLLCAIAIPAFTKARHTTQKKIFLNDIRVAVDAFQMYNIQHYGQYPPNASPGVMPPLMTDYLTKFHWDKPPTIGGVWDWDYKTGVDQITGVSVRGPTWSDDEMQEIDAEIDNGDLATGNFRKINTDFTYIIE